MLASTPYSVYHLYRRHHRRRQPFWCARSSLGLKKQQHRAHNSHRLVLLLLLLLLPLLLLLLLHFYLATSSPYCWCSLIVVTLLASDHLVASVLDCVATNTHTDETSRLRQIGAPCCGAQLSISSRWEPEEPTTTTTSVRPTLVSCKSASSSCGQDDKWKWKWKRSPSRRLVEPQRIVVCERHTPNNIDLRQQDCSANCVCVC